jgi:four helix bundle protein
MRIVYLRMATSYRDLEVWQLSRQLVKDTYLITKQLPKEERYGLTAQIRSAVISVPANIAEGYGRSHRGDYLHHLSIARGSLYEVENYFILLSDLELVKRSDVVPLWKLVEHLGNKLSALILSLKRTTAKATKSGN